jgi:membrane protease subunit (stomatin/prohibitin family)
MDTNEKIVNEYLEKVHTYSIGLKGKHIEFLKLKKINLGKEVRKLLEKQMTVNENG